MLEFLLPVLKFLGDGAFKSLVDGYKAKLEAGNNSEKIAAELAGKDLELQGRERELNVKQNIADEGRWWTAAPRAIVCWSIALFIAKAVVWDKMLGLGVTPELKGFVSDVGSAVIVMWFGGRTIEKVARIWRPR